MEVYLENHTVDLEEGVDHRMFRATWEREDKYSAEGNLSDDKASQLRGEIQVALECHQLELRIWISYWLEARRPFFIFTEPKVGSFFMECLLKTVQPDWTVSNSVHLANPAEKILIRKILTEQ